MKKNKVWFITGCSTGFGREIAKHVLQLGYNTVVTARNPKDIEDLAAEKNALALKLDVTKASEVKNAVLAAKKKFGHIDVLVNNAGIGYFSAIESSDDAEVRKMFEVNFFGLCAMTNAVLPGMRKRKSGSIINFSSICGLCSSPALGYYDATKHAVEGISEALAQEVDSLGIKVMIVEPSGFRTDWAGRSAQQNKHPIADYASTAGKAEKKLRAQSGKQKGDPVLAARAIVKAIESGHPPLHLLLGNSAVDGAIEKITSLKKEFLLWEKVSRAADNLPERRAL